MRERLRHLARRCSRRPPNGGAQFAIFQPAAPPAHAGRPGQLNRTAAARNGLASGRDSAAEAIGAALASEATRDE